jgi:hypothetical protein
VIVVGVSLFFIKHFPLSIVDGIEEDEVDDECRRDGVKIGVEVEAK